MTELSKKIGEMNYDGLITDIIPAVQTRGGVIAKLTASEDDTVEPTVYKRGTLLGRNAAGKLVVYDGETDNPPDCILCDDVTVDDKEDVTVTVYTAGCFNTNKVTVADSYTLTGKDFTELRKLNIVFKAAAAAN